MKVVATTGILRPVDTYLDSAKVALKHSQPTLTLIAVALTTAMSMPQVLDFDVDFLSLLATIPFAAMAVLYATRNDRPAAIALVVGIVLAFIAKGEFSADTMDLVAMWVLTLLLLMLPHEHADFRDGASIKTAIGLGAWLIVAMLAVLIRNDTDSLGFGGQGGFFATSNLLTLLNAAIIVLAMLALLRRPIVSFSIAVVMLVAQFVETFANQFQDSFDGFPVWLRIEQIVLSLPYWLPLAIVAAVLMKPQAKAPEQF
jgi:hypothetical protein